MAVFTASNNNYDWSITYTYDPTGVTVTDIYVYNPGGSIWPGRETPNLYVGDITMSGYSYNVRSEQIYGTTGYTYYITCHWTGNVKVKNSFNIKFAAALDSSGFLGETRVTLTLTQPWKTVTVTASTQQTALNLCDKQQILTVSNTSAVAAGGWSYTYRTTVTIGGKTAVTASDSALSRTVTVPLSIITTKATSGTAKVEVLWNGTVLTSAMGSFSVLCYHKITAGNNTTNSSRLMVNGTNKLTVTNTSAGTAGYSYKITVTCGEKSAEVTDGECSRGITIPVEWLGQANTRGTITVALYYSSTLLMSATSTWYMEPAGGVADINNVSFTVTPRSNTTPPVPESWKVFVQGKSYTHTEADASIKYGSLTFTVTVGMLTLQGKSLDFTVVMRAEEYKCKLVVTDSWGRTATKETSFTVLPYAAPGIETAKAYRCNEDGSENDKGLSYLASAEVTYADCGGHNVPKLTLESKLSTESSYKAVGDVPIGGRLIVKNGAPDIERSYDVCFILADAFNTVRYYATVLTGDYFMYFKRGGKGVAVGKAAELDDTFDVGYDLRVRGDTVLDGEMTFNRPDGSRVTLSQILEKLGL